MAAPAVPDALDMRFHDTQPDGFKASYLGGDTVSFTLFAGPDRAVVPGTVYLEGELQVMKDGTPATQLLVADAVYLDAQTGMHGIVANTNTATEAQGQIENVGAYPQVVRAITDGTLSRTDLQTKANLAMLRLPADMYTTSYLTGAVVQDIGQAGTQAKGVYHTDPSFSFAPQIALNRANAPVAFSRTGKIRTTFRLADARDAFFGPGLDPGTNPSFAYQLKNLTVRYNTVPSADAPKLVMARTNMTSQQTLATHSSSISVVLPAAAVDSFTLTFRSHAALNNPLLNNLITERITGLNNLVLMVNESLSGPVTKPINDEVEALRLGLLSLGPTVHNSEKAVRLELLDGYLLGYPLGSPTNVAQVPFGVQISADGISNATPFLMTIIAHASISF